MIFPKIKWFRRLIRKHTNPIPINSAALWKKRLAVGYAICAWQAFGIVIYLMYKGHTDAASYKGLKSEEDLVLTPAQQYTRMLGMRKTNVIRISGTNVSTYTVENEFDEKKNLLNSKIGFSNEKPETNETETNTIKT